jgi:hypothetical protein
VKITIDTKQLLKYLRLAADIDRRSGTAATAVKLKVTKTKTTLHIVNREQSIRLPLYCKIEQTGQVILPWSDLLAVIRHTKDKMVTLGIDADCVLVRGPTLHYSKKLLSDPDNCPDVQPFKCKSYIEFTTEALRGGLKRTMFAAVGKEYHHRALDCVCFEFPKKGVVDIVASDGIGLAWQRLAAICVGDIKPERIAIPLSVLVLAEKLLADAEDTDTVKMFMGPSKNKKPEVIWLSVAGITAVFRLSANTISYPEWRPIIDLPAISPTMLFYPGQEVLEVFLPALKSRQSHTVILEFNQSLIISAQPLGVPSVNLILRGLEEYRDKLEVKLKHLVDALKAVQGAEMVCLTVRDLAKNTQCSRYSSVLFQIGDGFSYVLHAKEVTEE